MRDTHFQFFKIDEINCTNQCSRNVKKHLNFNIRVSIEIISAEGVAHWFSACLGCTAP